LDGFGILANKVYDPGEGGNPLNPWS